MSRLREREKRISDSSRGALSGVRVVDLSTTFMGPYCSMFLASCGADVVKVEAPAGDVLRYVGDARESWMGPVFLNTNRGKRGLVLDLKAPRAGEVLQRLIRWADVFMHNMRPAAAERAGITAAAVAATNPRCVYGALRGFGSGGPYRDKAAYDDVIQAASGMAVVQGAGGDPQYVRTAAADKIVGIVAAASIITALFERERTGEGRAVEVPMFETMASFMLLEQQGGWVYDPPEGPSGYTRTQSLYRRPYRTRDGFLAVMIYTDGQWKAMFDLLGRPELTRDSRFTSIRDRTEHIDDLYAMVEKELAARTTAEWLAAFEAAHIPATAVNSIEDLFTDRHLDAVGFFDRVDHPTEGPLRLARFPVDLGAGPPSVAPRLGEHTVEVMGDLGYSTAEIDDLVRDGVVAPAGPVGSGSEHDGEKSL